MTPAEALVKHDKHYAAECITDYLAIRSLFPELGRGEDLAPYVQDLKASYVPQPVALMMLAALDRADMGPQGSTNDLGSMVRRACEEVTRLRAEVERLTLAPETVAMLRTRAAYPRSPWVGLEAVDAHLNASRAWVEAGGPNLPTDEEETSR